MKFLKPLLIVFVLMLSLGGYVWFQKSINLPRYDHFIARHLAGAAHINHFNANEKVDYVVLGDSTGLHTIQPKKLTVKADNLCLSGASALDTFYVLKRIDIKKVRKGIILGSSFYANSHYDKHMWERFISTDFYSFAELWEIYKESSLTHTYPASELSVPSFFLKVAFAKLYLFPQAVKSFLAFPVNQWKGKKIELYFSQKAESEKGFISHPKDYPIPAELFDESWRSFYSKPFKIDPTDLLYLRKIVDYSRQNGLKVYLLSPVLADEAKHIDASAFKNTFDSFFKNFEKQTPGFYYIQLPHSSRLNDFFDFNHLNEQGADNLAPEISDIIGRLELNSK